MRTPLLAFVAAAFSACTFPSILETALGPFTYTVDATRFAIPATLVDTNGSIRSISCQTDMGCPALGAGQPAVHCVGGVCDPDAFVFELASDPIDLNQNATVAMYGSNVNRIDVISATYSAMPTGITTAVGPTLLYWGPATATSTAAPDVHLLGTIPAMDFALTPTIDAAPMTLDSAGASGLSTHLLSVSRTMRLFVRPSVDLAPGNRVPMGSLRLDLSFKVHVEGQLVR